MKRSPLLIIFITVFIDLVGFGIVIPILPLYVVSPQFNASPLAVGLLFASYSVMQLIFTPLLGRLSDRHGRRPVLLLSVIGTGIGFLIMGSATMLWMLFVGRILDGITGGNISTAQAYVADVTTPENRAKGMGMFGAAFGLGFIFGPAIGGILSRWGISVPFYFAAALAFTNAVLIYFALPETITRDHPARAFASRSWTYFWRQLTQRKLALVLLIYFLFIVAFSIMTTIFSLYTAYRFNYDAQHNGYLFAYIGIISAFVQGGLIGRLVKRWGEMPLVIVGALLLTSTLPFLAYIGPSPQGGLAAMLAIIAGMAIGNSLATPSLTSLASKSVGASEQGGVMGVTQSAASLARIVGPLIGGYLISSPAARPLAVDDHSVRVTFWTAAAIMFAAFLLAIYLSRSQAADYAGAKEVTATSS